MSRLNFHSLPAAWIFNDREDGFRGYLGCDRPTSFLPQDIDSIGFQIKNSGQWKWIYSRCAQAGRQRSKGLFSCLCSRGFFYRGDNNITSTYCYDDDVVKVSININLRSCRPNVFVRVVLGFFRYLYHLCPIIYDSRR
jgi:hypothetical protein